MKDEMEELADFLETAKLKKYSDKPSRYAVSLVNEILEEEDQSYVLISES